MARNEMESLSGVDIFSERKGLLITPERCTGCRGCQAACKEWNKLPAEKTINTGTYENPPDLTENLFNKIRFVEVQKENLKWLFISQRCMHCGDAGCMEICPAPGAITRNKQGAVVYDKEKCIGCKLCQTGCPFGIPRYDEKDKISKCHLCEDRISSGLSPACAKTCPTGAIRYGDRTKLMSTAKKEGYSTLYGQADLAGLGVMYAFKETPEFYGFKSAPGVPASIEFWRNILKPLSLIGFGAAVFGAFAHYLAVGPHDDEEGGEQ